MATPTALKALQDTQEALVEIRRKLQPLLTTLQQTDETSSADDRAVAQAGVALTMGTLRFMAQRLRGSKGSLPNGQADPLRQELNRMRKLLVQVQKKASKSSTAVKRQSSDTTSAPTRKAQSKKRRKSNK